VLILVQHENHTAHTPEQARLAESMGVTAAIRALGGRWWTEEMQEEALEVQCSQPDACPCFKGGCSNSAMRWVRPDVLAALATAMGCTALGSASQSINGG